MWRGSGSQKTPPGEFGLLGLQILKQRLSLYVPETPVNTYAGF